MALAEVRDAALEASEQVPHLVDGPVCRRLGLLNETLDRHPDHLGAFPTPKGRLLIQSLDQRVRHADGDLLGHGVHCIPTGGGDAESVKEGETRTPRCAAAPAHLLPAGRGSPTALVR